MLNRQYVLRLIAFELLNTFAAVTVHVAFSLSARWECTRFAQNHISVFYPTGFCFALAVIAREYNFEAVSRHKLLCAMVEYKGIQFWSTAQATLSRHWHKLLCWMAGAPSQVSGLFARAPFISKLQTSTILKPQVHTLDLTIAQRYNLETTLEHCWSSDTC